MAAPRQSELIPFPHVHFSSQNELPSGTDITAYNFPSFNQVFIQRGRKIRRHQNAQTHNNHMNHRKDGGASANLRQQHRRRTKRSISSPRHVEALIVVDSSMVAFHDDAEQYMLTIMNMVSSLYKDPSIGNSIQIVIVRIILIEDEEAHPDLNLTENAQRNLQMFCS